LVKIFYTGAWQDSGKGILMYTISAIPGGAIPSDQDYPVTLSYEQVSPMNVTKSQIIGGMDIETGQSTGIEVIEDVFPRHSIVPGVLLVPFWTQDPEVAAVCSNKVDEINGCFRCITLTDIDSTVVKKPMDVYEWKQKNNYVHGRQGALWPRVGLMDKDIWLSTEFGARILKTDNDNGNVPVETPSNKVLEMNKTLVGPFDVSVGPPKEIIFSKDYGDMLNGQGILTAINWIGGWKAWGSNMACYPFITDPKDRWMPARRMTDFVGNSLVLTVFQKVDKPTNRRLIDTIVDTTNIWLNSLVSSGNAMGARVEFRHDENPDTEMINGHYLFHVYEFFPLPAEWIEFKLELDLSYLSVLFEELQAA
jgi:phage tail sheath protein FI